MKLGKIRRGLILLMSLAISCPMVFAGEAADSQSNLVAAPVLAEKAEGIIGSSETMIVGEETATDTEAVEETEVADYKATEKTKIERIKKEGTALGMSKTMGNIKVTAEYILADSYTYQVLLSVEHMDQTPFAEAGYSNFRQGMEFMTKSQYEERKLWESLPEDASFEERIKVLAAVKEEYKQFVKEDGTVDVDGFLAAEEKSATNEEDETIAEASYVIGSSSCSLRNCEVEGTPDYKQYFLLEGSVNEPLEEEMVLELGEYQEYENKTCEMALSLVDYLKAHQEETLKTKPYEVDEGEKEYLEKLKADDETAYQEHLAYLERQPKILLEDGGLKLELVKEVPHYWIDNIGFIDGQLHIKFLGDQEEEYNVAFYNEQDGFVETTYGGGSMGTDEKGNVTSESYYVFRIKDLEELKKYDMQITRTVPAVTIKESCDFEMNLTRLLHKKNIAVNQKVALTKNETATLKNVVLTDLSLILEFDDFKRTTDNDLSMELTLKDGSKVREYGAQATSINKNKAKMIYQLDNSIEDIAKISVGGIEISVNE